MTLSEGVKSRVFKILEMVCPPFEIIVTRDVSGVRSTVSHLALGTHPSVP